ncbi:unnamed protein product [Linum trigynum]|uniref:Uncharacterized protein n=1 Tax=Linum trigynum TaxID=586398 RepID=A0AAV2CJ96_9ROSI
MHVIHPPQHKSDNYHLEALTSSTLGSLKLESVNDGGVDSPNAPQPPTSAIEETKAGAEEEEAIYKKPHSGKCGKDYFDPNIISIFRKSLRELFPSHPSHLKKPAKEKDRVILYFTSLRGVRKTYEDNCYLRVILKGVGVRVDE